MDQKFVEFLEEKESKDQIEVISDNVKKETDTNPVHMDVLCFTLGNGIIMENIVNSMGLEDLDHWYKFCEKFQLHDVTNLDRICWKKRAQKLAEAYKTKPLTQTIEERWPKTSY